MTETLHTFKSFNHDLYKKERMVMWCGLALDMSDHTLYTRGEDGTCEDCESAKALDLLARVP